MRLPTLLREVGAGVSQVGDRRLGAVRVAEHQQRRVVALRIAAEGADLRRRERTRDHEVRDIDEVAGLAHDPAAADVRIREPGPARRGAGGHDVLQRHGALPVSEDVADADRVGGEAPVVSDHQETGRVGRGAQDALDLLLVEAHRLLEPNVLARAKRGLREVRV